MAAMTTTPDETLRTGAAAKRLGVSRATVRRWADAGLLPYLRFPSGQRRFRPADIDAIFADLVDPT